MTTEKMLRAGTYRLERDVENPRPERLQRLVDAGGSAGGEDE